jgi:hypothetical protein
VRRAGQFSINALQSWAWESLGVSITGGLVVTIGGLVSPFSDYPEERDQLGGWKEIGIYPNLTENEKTPAFGGSPILALGLLPSF